MKTIKEDNVHGQIIADANQIKETCVQKFDNIRQRLEL